MKKLYIGWAEESLVPAKKVSFSGQFFERISEYTESPITVTACAVECDGQCAILLSVDIVSLQQALIDAIRSHFARICPEVDPENLIIFATHSHTSLTARTANTDQISIVSINKVLEEFFPGRQTLHPPKPPWMIPC